MEEQLEQSKRRLHFCMALIGGWFGAYAILRFHHFASAVTVNFIEVFTSAVQENWIKALLRLGIVILYVFTIFLAACLSKRCKGDLRMWAILSDAAAACVLSVLPEHLSELGASSGACLPENTGIPVPPSFLPTTSASLWMPGSRPIYSGIRTISPG